MTEVKVNVPFVVSVEDKGGHAEAYAFDVPDTTVAYGSAAGVVKEMRARIVESVTNAVKESSSDYRRSWVIGTGDGSVFIVRRAYGCWCYSICGSGRKYASGVHTGDDYTVCLESARKHAADFGGILWEHAA